MCTHYILCLGLGASELVPIWALCSHACRGEKRWGAGGHYCTAEEVGSAQWEGPCPIASQGCDPPPSTSGTAGTKHAIRAMQELGIAGSIINTTSISAIGGAPAAAGMCGRACGWCWL